MLAAPAVYCIHGCIIGQATGRQTVPNVNEKHAPSPFGCHSTQASVVKLLKLLICYDDLVGYKGENG